MMRIAAILAAVLLVAACGRVEPPVVDVAGETLRGTWAGDGDDVAAFLGVPFAAPPVGPLRWRAPAPLPPGDGVRRADRFAPACVQGSYSVDWYADVAAAFGQPRKVVEIPVSESEDCLYLNVWTPAVAPESPLPVMVFVHGGANRGGWSYEPNYVGDRLAARGVVVVTIAYRLGPLGFFAHPAIDNGAEPAANFGLLDIRAALAWVRRHIAAFGGDPERVTAFGESAGAANLVDIALAGPDADPGFDRLIVQSIGGAVAGRRVLAAEHRRGLRLASELGLEAPVTAEALRAVTAANLLDAVIRLWGDEAFEAVIDGATLLHDPVEGLRGERAARLELLAGTNRDEWLMYLDPSTDADDVESWIRGTAPEFAGSIRDVIADEADPRRALDRLETARHMLCPTRMLAERVSGAGGQAYVYWFTREREGGASLGAYHGAELPYVFDRHDDWLPTGDTDRSLTARIVDYWVSFAATGQPQSAGGPAWPVYAGARPWVMELGDSVGLVSPHDLHLCRYLAPAKP